MAPLDTDFWLMQVKPGKQMAKSLATRNPAMLTCLRLAKKCAAAHCPVMITGETGVGKYLVASYLHRHSPRASRPLMTLECGELREGEIRTALFGPAGSRAPAPDGRLHKAAGGTLILRGVEQLTGPMQRELLTLLHEYARAETNEAGENVSGETGLGRDLGVRLISTSSAGLGSMAKPGLFSEDLFFALGEVTLRIPPLRERREDVDHLAAMALEEAANNGASALALSGSAREFLRHYSFPGNISELFRMVDRAARAGRSDTVHMENLLPLAEGVDGIQPANAPLLSLGETERIQLNRVLLHTGWKKNAAARILRISETMLNRKIRVYGLDLD